MSDATNDSMDELLSADLDGETTPAEHDRIAADFELRSRQAELMSASGLAGQSPPPLDTATVDDSITRALDALPTNDVDRPIDRREPSRRCGAARRDRSRVDHHRQVPVRARRQINRWRRSPPCDHDHSARLRSPRSQRSASRLSWRLRVGCGAAVRACGKDAPSPLDDLGGPLSEALRRAGRPVRDGDRGEEPSAAAVESTGR